MRIEDLNNILKEYYKHFGQDKMNEYFKTIIKLKKEKKDAIGKKKSNGSGRSN
tara:strand:- start:18 stop:176 length:159 start_codon:yes stop_codon:yes gene_type:complete